MPDKLDIEIYCNRFERLFSLVDSLSIGSISNSDKEKLINSISEISVHFSNIGKNTSSCSALSDAEKNTYGIVQTENADVDKAAEEIGMDPKELMYFLVCAKMPYYLSKVERSLKSSFVDAASSLYYLERNYLVSFVLKLFELECQIKSGVLNDSFICEVVEDCIYRLKGSNIANSLITFLVCDIQSLNKLSYRYITMLSDEISLITRSLFFYYSFSAIKQDDFLKLVSVNNEINSLQKKVSKDNRVHQNAFSYVSACLDLLELVSLNSFTDFKEAGMTEEVLLGLLTTLKEKHNHFVIPQFSVCLQGLQRKASSKDFRHALRHCLRNGVFSLLYKTLLCIHVHMTDSHFLFILTSLFYKLVYTYLSIQSSQWHTLTSKQFSLSNKDGTSYHADGIENIVYLLQFILSKLPGLNIVLSGSDLEDNILPYFCSMISDRLRAEPYLFNTYINLLTAIAKTSQVSANSIYEFIDKAPSEFVSWPIMMGCLNEAEKLIHSDNAQRGLLDHDLTGFICILDLLTAVMKNSSSCPNIHGNMQVDTIQLYVKLLHEPIHVLLKSKILAVLTCFAKDYSYAMMILSQLEYGRILTVDNTAGIRYELLNVETPAGMYPLTVSFLQLLIQLSTTCSAATLVSSSCFPPMIDFVINTVFNEYDIRNAFSLRSGEKYMVASLCLQFLSSFLTIFPDVFNNREDGNNKLVLERLCLIISELLSYNEVMNKILKIATISPAHTLLNTQTVPTDCLHENTLFIDFDLLDSYFIQVELVNHAMVLVRHLLEITPEMICELGLFSQSSKAHFTNSLSSQLLTDSHLTVTILLNITNTSQPSLQFSTLQVLRLLVDQLSTNLFITLFDSYPLEAMAIRSSINQLFIQTVFTHVQEDTTLALPTHQTSTQFKVKSVQLLLDLLIAHGSQSFPSSISSLLLFPQALSSAHAEGNIGMLFTSLLTFLETPSLIAFHPLTASKVAHFILLLCQHKDKSFLSELCSVLIDRRVFFRIISAFPFLLEHANNHYIPQLGGKPSFISSFKPYSDEERLGVYSLIYYSLSILTILVFQQKQYHIGLQFLGEEITSLFSYNESVRLIFMSDGQPAPTTSPLLDTLSLVDQHFSEPTNKPVYMNDCCEGCWVQRELNGTKFIQIDLLQLVRNIEAALKSTAGSSYEQIHYFVEEGTTWAYHWNVFMELEVMKNFVFQAGCSLLHINIIENKESVSLLSAYSDNPLDLYLAVIHALLSITTRTVTFDRTYVQSITELLLDLFSMLSTAAMTIPSFTQQSILLFLLQGVLSPLSQQQQNLLNVSIRSSYYLLLLTFLVYARKAETISLLMPTLHPCLDQLVHLLLTDIERREYEIKYTSLSLLNYLLETELKEECIHLVLSYETELQNLITYITFLTYHSNASSKEAHQQTNLIRTLLSFFTLLASTTPGALFLLNHSIFPAICQSSLLRLNSPPGYPVYPTKLSSLERNQIRMILKPILQFVISIVDTVRGFRGLRAEIVQFLLSTVNVSFIILEDRDPDPILALEVLALYTAVVSLIACSKESLKEEFKGFEEVIATKLLELMKGVKEDKKLCEEIRYIKTLNMEENKDSSTHLKQPSKKALLMKNVIEYSIIYIFNYGETISNELLKALGY